MIIFQETDDGDSHVPKLYSCPHCNRSFKGLNYFRFHVKGHLGRSTHCMLSVTIKPSLKRKLLMGHGPKDKYRLFLQVISPSSAHSAKKSFWLVTSWRNTWKFTSVRGDISVASVVSCTKLSDTYVSTWGPTRTKDPTTVADAAKDTKPRWVQCKWQLLFVDINVCLFLSFFLTLPFLAQNALQVHQRTHGEDKPYVCQFCLRGFREKGSLVRHIRHHTGEKPFKCQKCGRGFAEHGTLNRHLRAKGQCDWQKSK